MLGASRAGRSARRRFALKSWAETGLDKSAAVSGSWVYMISVITNMIYVGFQDISSTCLEAVGLFPIFTGLITLSLKFL